MFFVFSPWIVIIVTYYVGKIFLTFLWHLVVYRLGGEVLSLRTTLSLLISRLCRAGTRRTRQRLLPSDSIFFIIFFDYIN